MVSAQLNNLYSFNFSTIQLQQKLHQQYATTKGNVSLPTFNNYQLSLELRKALQEQEIYTPSSIQDLVLPQLLQLQYDNYYIAAQTGTGKTLAYLLPIFDLLKQQENKFKDRLTRPMRPRALILVPSKELAIQLEDVCKKLVHHCKLKTFQISNTNKFMEEQQQLQQGVDILISTIDRLEKHREKGNVFFSNLSYFVIDEADTFLDSGYREILQGYIQILQNKQDQVRNSSEKENLFSPKMVFVSATYTGALNNMFKAYFGQNCEFIKMLIEKKTHMNLQNLFHEFVHCASLDKKEPIIKLLKEVMPKVKKLQGAILIFCNSIPSCQSLEYSLMENGYECVSLHGDVPKKLRIQNFDRFKQQQVKIMISTDLGSRGLDFPFLTHVINFDFPITTSDYLHRAGRTGRAGKKGWVISLYHNKDNNIIKELQKASDSNAPVYIKGSSYSKINREILTRLKEQEKQGEGKYQQLRKQMSDQQRKIEKQLIPQNYISFRQKWEQSKESKQIMKKYIPQKSKEKDEMKKLLKYKRSIKKHDRVKLGKQVKNIDIKVRKLRKNIYYKMKKENQQLNTKNKK